MAKISLEEWTRYKNWLHNISQRAEWEFYNHYTKGMTSVSSMLNNISRQELIDYVYGLATKYGEASAEVSCQMIEAIAELEGVAITPTPAKTATYNETAKAVNGAMKQSPSGQLVTQVLQRLVKQAASDTTCQNAVKYGAELAWIPSGDTCPFCLTLASRGWQRASKKTLKNGHAEHIHAHCDCQHAISFKGGLEVEGYDPQEYLDMYNSYDGKSNDRVNAMRRELYQSRKEEINAQKRASYAKRKLSDQ